MKIISDHQRGFTLLEGLAGLIILMVLIALGGQHLQQRLEEQLHRNVAAHLRMVANAAERYLLDRDVPLNLQKEREQWENEQKTKLNNPNPPKNAPPYVPQSLEEWRYQQLIDNKYLPEGFNPTNLYRQHYALYVEAKTAPQPHQQLLVMTTDGQAIQERFLRQSARYLGRQGGYLSGKKSKKITGSQQGWHLTLPPKTLYQTPEEPATANPPLSLLKSFKKNFSDPLKKFKQTAKPSPEYEKPGHLASLSLLYESDRLRHSALLHRTTMPHPQEKFNQMETDLNLQGHQIRFEGDNTSGTLSASMMELTAQQKPNQVKLACDASNPTITVTDGSGTLDITAQKVAFSGHQPPKKWTDNYPVENYSPSELHRYWNKVAYYELTDQNDEGEKATQSFANQVCQEAKVPGSSEQTLGRLFMLGTQHQQTTFLYLCTTHPQGELRAHLLKSMDPSE